MSKRLDKKTYNLTVSANRYHYSTVSHQWTPYCRGFLNCERDFQNLTGISKILGISPGFSEDSKRISEDALLLEVMWKEFQQVAWVVVDMGEEVVQPFAYVDLGQLAAAYKVQMTAASSAASWLPTYSGTYPFSFPGLQSATCIFRPIPVHQFRSISVQSVVALQYRRQR